MRRRVTFWLKLAVGVPAFVGSVLYGGLLLLARRDPAHAARDTARVMARLVLRALRIRVVVEGAEHLGQRPCVVVANHQSWLEYPIFASIFPEGTIILGASYIAKFPLVAWVYERTGNVYLERERKRSAHGTMARLSDAILTRRKNLWVFPEGTRGPGGGRLLPFKRGGFRVAIETGVPVVPVVLSVLQPHLDLGGRRLDDATVQIRVLPPVPTAGLSIHDQGTLIDRVRADMERTLRELETRPGLRTAVTPGGADSRRAAPAARSRS